MRKTIYEECLIFSGLDTVNNYIPSRPTPRIGEGMDGDLRDHYRRSLFLILEWYGFQSCLYKFPVQFCDELHSYSFRADCLAFVMVAAVSEAFIPHCLCHL